ncbi:uncharacterized protein LOC120335696 [Styela clava]
MAVLLKVFFLELTICGFLVASTTGNESSNRNDYKCTRPGICIDGTGKEFRCVVKNMECCLNSQNILSLYQAPRGMTCCGGDGMFHEQTHDCVINEKGDGEIQLRENVIFCPGTEMYYNPSSQFCSTGESGKTEVLMLKDYSLNSASPYTDVNRPYTCVSSRVCSDSSGRRFKCTEKNVECCLNSFKQLVFSNAKRGMTCCDGDGMYLEQTQECVDGKITLRKNAIVCPGTEMYHNPSSQICCTGSSGLTEIHMIEDGKLCCGTNYIKNSTTGCCSEEAYDRKAECCKNRIKAPAKECVDPTGDDSRKNSRLKCTKETVCSDRDMEKRSKSFNHWSYMYTFEVSRFKRETETHLVYRVKLCRQFIGTRRKKIGTEQCNLKYIEIPRCECPGQLVPGVNYVLRTRQKLNSRRMVLNGKKFYISQNKL